MKFIPNCPFVLPHGIFATLFNPRIEWIECWKDAKSIEYFNSLGKHSFPTFFDVQYKMLKDGQKKKGWKDEKLKHGANAFNIIDQWLFLFKHTKYFKCDLCWNCV